MFKYRVSEEKADFYESIGFDSNLNGCAFFDDLVEDVRQILDTQELSFDKVKKILPILELESYHFFFEVGRYQYLEDIETFLKSRYENKKKYRKSRAMYTKIFGNSELINMDRSIYRLAKYLNGQRNLQDNHVKHLVK